MMKITTREIDGAEVVAFTPLDERHTPTGNRRHLIAGKPIGTVGGLVIASYEKEEGFYLFRCNAHWEPITDTFHSSMDEAKKHAEFEYRGSRATWTVTEAQQTSHGNAEKPPGVEREP